MPKIVIPGGSGQIGQILARHFHRAGQSVTTLARHPQAAEWRTAGWDSLAAEVDGADVVINLAGRSVNCRYNAPNRREILESRVDSTRAIGAAIAGARRPPALWINSSTATVYRHALDRPMDEATGEIGSGFSVGVATAWEQALAESPAPSRKIALRSAMVMSPDRGGVFDRLLGLTRVGLGGTAGPGTQYVSWVHEVDFIRAIEFLIARTDLDGAINVSAPLPLPNRDFMRELRHAAGVRIGLPATRWMLEIGAVFLRTETELLVKSRRVVPSRLLDAGFTFVYPEWPAAARELCQRA